MSNQVTDIDHWMQAPKTCEDCGCKLEREDWNDEPDTGCTACVTFTCNECSRCWVAPAPRKESAEHA